MQNKLVEYMAIFVALSTFDAGFTTFLIASGVAVEANPIAAMFENLILYKFAMVVGILTVITILSYLNRKAAIRVLFFGNLITFLVVLYSAAILFISQFIRV
jgi:hypothetical protein